MAGKEKLNRLEINIWEMKCNDKTTRMVLHVQKDPKVKTVMDDDDDDSYHPYIIQH